MTAGDKFQSGAAFIAPLAHALAAADRGRCVSWPACRFLWCDGVKIRKPIAVSAPQYVDLLMTWVESQLNDEEVGAASTRSRQLSAARSRRL